MGFGLNDEALTFNRLATVFGEAGATAGLAEFLVVWLLLLVVFWFVLDVAPFAATGVLEVVVITLAFCLPLSFPLKGGIVWMTMLIFFVAGLSAGLAAVAAAAAEAAATLAIFCALAAVIDAWTLLEAIFDPSACVIGLRVESEFLVATGKPREAVVGLEAPMARAWDDAASLLAFSLIACCLSPSFARIGTRSSGIGLFNLKS